MGAFSEFGTKTRGEQGALGTGRDPRKGGQAGEWETWVSEPHFTAWKPKASDPGL